MAGRGFTISVQLLGRTGSGDEVDELSLQVAGHSPLIVLKQQLEDVTGIPVQEQVLILLDLTDPERNNDVLLIGRDDETIRNCRIRNGSTLTLHPLGLSAEDKLRMTQLALGKLANSNKSRHLTIDDGFPVHRLVTELQPRDVDHSFNGVIFDIMNKTHHSIELLSVSIGGMLGRIRIYARGLPWEMDKPPIAPNPHHWWAHRDRISNNGWSLLTDVNCLPSWDRSFEIPLRKSLVLGPHEIKALYLHSSLPDDLGIQYQSFSKDAIVAEDAHLSIHPGLGHTGSRPFDDEQGWYRSYRGPAGSFQYKIRPVAWSPQIHHRFPTFFKQAVWELLRCQNRMSLHYHACQFPELFSSPATSPQTIEYDPQDPAREQLSELACCHILGRLPHHIIWHIIEFMHWDWFIEIYGEAMLTLLTDAGSAYNVLKVNRNRVDLPHVEQPLRRSERLAGRSPELSAAAANPGAFMTYLLQQAQAMGAQLFANNGDEIDNDYDDDNGDDDDDDYDDDYEDDDHGEYYEVENVVVGSDDDEDDDEDEIEDPNAMDEHVDTQEANDVDGSDDDEGPAVYYFTRGQPYDDMQDLVDSEDSSSDQES